MVKRIWSFLASFVTERRSWRTEMETTRAISERETARIEHHHRQSTNPIERAVLGNREGTPQ